MKTEEKSDREREADKKFIETPTENDVDAKEMPVVFVQTDSRLNKMVESNENSIICYCHLMMHMSSI